MLKRDENYMHKALEHAKQAYDQGEVPVGAIIISPYGEIIGDGYNTVERDQCQIHHAEANAIAQATKKTNDWRLDGCTLYVTLEPCMMCISLSALSRIERIVYGADSPVFGYRLDKEGVLALYTKQIKNITGGVCAREATTLVQRFFEHKREGI